MPSPTRYPPCKRLKSRLVIAAFVGVVCLGYVCMISIDRSVSLKSQSNVAWLRSQTHTTFNTTKTATRETFHHAPKVVYTTKMGLLSTVSDTSAGDIIYVEKKQALLVTSQEKQVAVLEGFSDIIHMKPPTFLANYKNPCWFETVPTMANGQFRHPVNVSKFSCLPYYMIVGQPKSGTTDLYYALQIHPDVTKCNIKEPHWWTRKRKNAEMSMLSRYVAYFSDAAQQIQKIIRITSTGERFHPRITGEASASTFWDMSYWRKMPENRGLDEPQYLTAHYIKHILPEVKIMVILRNPLDRLLSDSFYFSRAKTLEMFHGHVVESVAILRGCFQQRDVQRCLNDTTITNQLKARVHLGLYHVFLVAWLNVFPRNQVKVLQLEEYSRNRTAAMTDIFNFLDLDPLPAAEALMLQEAAVRNKRPDKRRSRSMLTKTRMLLEQFYRPFNERLASLLGDDKFLWNTSLPSVTASTAGLT